MVYNFYMFVYVMKKKRKIISRQVSVVNDLGIHARSAAKIAKVAENAKKNVWLKKNEEKVDAKSILDILMLACGRGTVVLLEIEDESDMEVLEKMVDLFKDGFGE